MNGTKRAIADSFMKLLQKKPIPRITINEITEGCGVSRMTFYYHFRDIYDLAEWICEETLREALDSSSMIQNWEKSMYSMLVVMRENKNFLLNVFRSLDADHVTQYLLQAIKGMVMKAIGESSAGLDITEADQKYVAGFYTYGLIGVILQWSRDGMNETPAEIVEKVSRMIQGGLRLSLERLSSK